MRLFGVCLVALAGIAGIQATAPAVPRTITRNGREFKVIDMKWDVELNDTHSTVVTGTIQDVFRTISEANPAAAVEIEQSMATLNESLAAGTDFRAASALFPPSQSPMCKDNPTDMECPISGRSADEGFANVPQLWEGVIYLDRVPGKPRMSPGPGECARVSCSWQSGIFWCNEVQRDMELASFRCIADGAVFLLRNCMSKIEQIKARVNFGEVWAVEVYASPPWFPC